MLFNRMYPNISEKVKTTSLPCQVVLQGEIDLTEHRMSYSCLREYKDKLYLKKYFRFLSFPNQYETGYF